MKARYQFQHPPYSPPKIKRSGVLFCELRGECVFRRMTDSPMPWPMARLPGKGQRKPFIVITPELIRMMNQEATVTICHMLGITGQTVVKWRTLLGLPKGDNSGTKELRRKYAARPIHKRSLKLAHAKLSDPERCEKIRQSKLGKPRPQHVIDAMNKARAGKPVSAETRRKMSKTHRRIGTKPPTELALAALRKKYDAIKRK